MLREYQTEEDISGTEGDFTLGVILGLAIIGVVIGLLMACGLAAAVRWWFG